MSNYGFSLLEVLIATFILAFGCLSIAALEKAAVARSYDDYLRSIASSRLRNVCERFYFDKNMDNIADWDKENRQILPHVSSSHNCRKNACTIKLCWQGHAQAQSCITTVAISY